MIIKKLIIKLWYFIRSPRRIEKLRDTTDFHKKCNYYKLDIQRLFDDGFFEFTNGSMEYYRDFSGKIRSKPKLIKYV